MSRYNKHEYGEGYDEDDDYEDEDDYEESQRERWMQLWEKNKREYGEDYDEDDEKYDKERWMHEWDKNKRLYKENFSEDEPYERVEGEGRGISSQYFSTESFEELQEFDESHEWVEVRKDREHYENYIREIGEEKDALVVEHDELTSKYKELVDEYNRIYTIEKEKSKPFNPDVEGLDEIMDLNDQLELIESKTDVLGERFSDASLWATLDELKSKEKHWAERYGRELEQIRKDEITEKERIGEFYERGEEYYSSEDSSRSKRYKMSLKLEMADNGLTSDALAEVAMDLDGMIQSGDGYVRAKENAEKMLDKVTYEQALESLAEGRKRGEYSDEKYYQMQVVIRRRYGV